ALGAVATAAMFLIGRGDWLFASLLFVLGNIGLSGANVFYNSLLPHIAREDEMDRVSSAGYALGYLGGGLLLTINLTWIVFPGAFGLADGEVATRLCFVSVAVWWLGFSIPLFRSVPEPPRRLEEGEVTGLNPVRVGVKRLTETFHEIRGYRHAFLFLLAFLAYNDGIGTINGMAAAYGTEIGLARSHLIGAILVVQFVGMPCTFLAGILAGRLGTKRTLYLALAVYVVISALAYFMTTALHFYALAILVGAVIGGSQALSRSLYASLIPRHKSAEFFSFLTVGSKFAGILGPAIFGWVSLLAGSSRLSILAIAAFFIVGMALLTRVDVPAGQRYAQQADRAFHAA
ncbi:MAG: MFS transporter, partial [Rhodospirillaceae bacterium]|nr:MFS transporter [Rhodospirillaceae bacterium]